MVYGQPDERHGQRGRDDWQFDFLVNGGELFLLGVAEELGVAGQRDDFLRERRAN